MRVVWITHNYPRYAGDVAGGFLHPLAMALCRGGVDVQVIAPADEGHGGHDTLDGVPIHRVRYGTASEERLAYRGSMASALRSPFSLLVFNRLRAALRAGASEAIGSNGGDAVVHAHWWVPAGMAAPPASPLVLTCHGTDVRLLDTLPFAAVVARPIFRRARVVTTVSRQLATTVERRCGVPIAPGEIQPMPVADLPRPLSDRTGDVVVIGRLTPQKRIHLALEAMAIARARGLARRLSIVGDGPARPALERQAAILQLGDAVRFVGEVAPNAVPECLAHAVCCLMPAEREGFGLAAAEALMQGVPVVACLDGGGLVDLVPAGGAGRVVASDADAIAGALQELVSDAGAGPAAREAGAPWRMRLTPDFVAGRCMDWYQRARRA